jgi:hypothetical protein
MADSFIAVAPDSTGKKLQTYKNTIGADEVHSEAVTLSTSAGVEITTLPVKITGAATMANGQVTASTSAATLVASRATRRSVTIRNTDTSISVYIGIAAVTAGNGMLLKPGESISIDFTGLIQVIAASGSPVVAYMETYD